MKCTFIPLVAFIANFILMYMPLYAQQDNSLQIKQSEIPSFDKLKDSIRVPEIDPRQYVIIYEWKEANEHRSRTGTITSERKLSEITKALTKVENHLSSTQKNLNDQVQPALGRVKSAFESKGIDILKVDNEIRDTYYSEDTINSIKKRAGLEDYSLILNYQYDSLKNLYQQYELKAITLRKEISKLERDRFQLNIQREHLQDRTDSARKPLNFYENIGHEYDGSSNSYEEYYNHIVWRNSATPDWEPIWWLNYYPWPNPDYRNIDLLNQDFRDDNFALIPFQKYEILNYKSTLRLVFDKNQLARNDDFKGSISIEASLFDGKDSNADPRAIEVNPYSVIGEEQKSIGLLNRPASEIADNLLKLVINGKLFSNMVEVLPQSGDNSIQMFIDDFEKNLDAFSDKVPPSGIIDSSLWKLLVMEVSKITPPNNIQTKNLSVKDGNLFKKAFNTRPLKNAIQLRDLSGISKEIKRLKEAHITFINAVDLVKINNKFTKEKYKDSREYLKLIINYLNYFDEEFGDTQSAFLKLVGSDKILFDHFLETTKNSMRNMEILFEKIEKSDSDKNGENINKPDSDKDDNELEAIYIYLKKLQTTVQRLIDIKGSPVAEVLSSLQYDNDFKKLPSDDPTFYYNYNYDDENPYNNEKTILDDPKDYKKLKEYIAEKAGEVLYQNLVYATIDLDLADAKDGDQLFIRMIWDKDVVNGKPAVDKSTINGNTNQQREKTAKKEGVALYVARFKLARTGWGFDTGESAILAKRIGEQLLRTNYPLVPTNYKLTGGAAMMWSYNNDHRVKKRIKYIKQTDIPRFNRKGQLKYNKFWVGSERFFKWLEPSFGLNLTYLDFTRTESFELGVGPSIGLFKNLIYLSGGVNLMELKEKPIYFGVGFSFVNIGTKIQDLKNTAGNN